jgi:hypothetical protein
MKLAPLDQQLPAKAKEGKKFPDVENEGKIDQKPMKTKNATKIAQNREKRQFCHFLQKTSGNLL